MGIVARAQSHVSFPMSPSWRGGCGKGPARGFLPNYINTHVPSVMRCTLDVTGIRGIINIPP